MVGSQLVDETDTTAFLTHVKHKPFALLIDHLHGAVQLFAAVALAGAEDVSGGAGGVHAHHDGLVFLPFAFLEREVGGSVVKLRVGNQSEIAPLCGKVHLLLSADEALFLQTIGNQLFNTGDGEMVLLRDFEQLRETGHGAIGIDDLDEGAHWFQTGELQQIDGAFSVAGADQHTAVTGAQRVHVPRTTEIGGLHRLVS